MDFHNTIARKCLEHFKTLPKSGKPTPNEWTVMSAIVEEDTQRRTFEVVAAATGSKCIGRSKLSPKGDVLNDSHAEVLCRRGFLQYLYHKIESHSPNSILIFNETTGKFSINDNISFHFFTTHVPCGDAAIFTKDDDDDIGRCVVKNDVSYDFSPNAKRIKLERDIHRTGAKCLPGDKAQDPLLNGVNFHQIGAIRTKPGRGDRTLSVSCSDKIAKWSRIGVQGALMSLLVDRPIYLQSFTIAGGTPFNEDALVRALYGRFHPVSSAQRRMTIGQAEHAFEFQKCGSKQPSPSSVIWSKHCNLEVAVEGKKQGITKKASCTKKARLSVSKVELFRKFIEITKLASVKVPINCDVKTLTYNEAKSAARDYRKSWDALRENVFKIWTVKDPNLLDFCVD